MTTPPRFVHVVDDVPELERLRAGRRLAAAAQATLADFNGQMHAADAALTKAPGNEQAIVAAE